MVNQIPIHIIIPHQIRFEFHSEIFDKSFLKLRDVNLSFNLPHSWTSKIKASSASIAVYARNILLWLPKKCMQILKPTSAMTCQPVW
jgi:hypothetical protein